MVPKALEKAGYFHHYLWRMFHVSSMLYFVNHYFPMTTILAETCQPKCVIGYDRVNRRLSKSCQKFVKRSFLFHNDHFT